MPTMMLVTCLAALLYFGGNFVFGVGSMILVGYRGARGGARGAGSAKAMRGLGGSEVGEGAVRGSRGSGMVVARGLGGMMFARSLGAEVVGGMTGFEGASSIGCWIGATGAGPGTGGTKPCSASLDAGDGIVDEDVALASAIGAFSAPGKIGATGAGPGTGGMKGFLAIVVGVAADLLKVPVALTSSKILLFVGVTGVACCAVFVCVGAAFGAGVSFFVL